MSVETYSPSQEEIGQMTQKMEKKSEFQDINVDKNIKKINEQIFNVSKNLKNPANIDALFDRISMIVKEAEISDKEEYDIKREIAEKRARESLNAKIEKDNKTDDLSVN